MTVATMYEACSSYGRVPHNCFSFVIICLIEARSSFLAKSVNLSIKLSISVLGNARDSISIFNTANICSFLNQLGDSGLIYTTFSPDRNRYTRLLFLIQ